MLAAANSVTVLVIGRVIVGLGVGLAGSVVPVYLSETSPSPVRGRIITLFQFCIVMGAFLSYLICYLLHRSWRLMFGVAIVPALV